MLNNIFRFLLFWLITCIVYRNAWGNQFIDDFLTGYVVFEERGWSSFKDSLSLYYGKDLLCLGFYDIFGLNKWAWFLLFTGMHAMNALLGFLFFQKIFQRNNIDNHHFVALSGSLLFLFSPYQTENVIWGATVHYGASMLLLWSGFFLYAGYLENKRWWFLLLFYVVFAYSLLTLEFSLVFPGIYFLVFVFLWNNDFFIDTVKTHFKKIALPMGVIIVLYFAATKMIKGVFIGHYGSETHSVSLLSFASAGTYLQYLAKLFGYIHFFKYPVRENVYELLKNPFVVIVVYTAIVTLLILLHGKNRPKARMAGVLIVLIFICLLPVSNMYFMYLNEVENARLSYFASFFAAMLLSVILSFPGKKIHILITITILLLNTFLLKSLVNRWAHANEIQYNALSTFRWENADRVFVLNQPCYYKGVYVFRNRTRFIRALKFFKHQEMQNKLIEVAWANQKSLNDNITVEPLSNTEIKVTLNEWGRWFWINNRGASDYSNEYYSAAFDEWNHSYTVTFKNKLGTNDVVIYFTPDGWKEIALNR
jgi:hypothetical protein